MGRFATDDTVLDIVVKGATRSRIALFSEGTEDPNPIHTDKAFAAAAGFPDVLQQGPMTTAHVARLLTERAGTLRSLDITFKAPVFPEEDLRITAQVDSVAADGAVTCRFSVEKIDGTITASGIATWG